VSAWHDEHRSNRWKKHEQPAAICPECGEPAAAVRNYKDGSKFYIHSQKAGLFVVEIDGCYVRAQEAAS
jgi:ssDNA-binding Zn-finger/Zn-ribbon topoisomerase 1